MRHAARRFSLSGTAPPFRGRRRAQLENRALSGVVWCWVGLWWSWVVPSGGWVVWVVCRVRGAERLRVLDESCELRGQTWGELTASGWTSETSVSTPGSSRSPSSSSCRTALPVCLHRAPCKPSNVIGTSVPLRRIDRAYYLDRCDVHSDTSDDTHSPTRQDAKRSRREPQ